MVNILSQKKAAAKAGGEWAALYRSHCSTAKQLLLFKDYMTLRKQYDELLEEPSNYTNDRRRLELENMLGL